jgi:hypothetical protein
MKPPDLTEDDRVKETVRELLELLQQFGSPLKRPANVVPWPKSGKKPQSEDRGRH